MVKSLAIKATRQIFYDLSNFPKYQNKLKNWNKENTPSREI